MITENEHSECIPPEGTITIEGTGLFAALKNKVISDVITEERITAGNNSVIIPVEVPLEDEPVIRHSGTPYEYTQEIDYKRSTNTYGYISAFAKQVSTNINAVPVLDSNNIRSELFNITKDVGVDSNLRAVTLDNIDNGGVIDLSIEEALQMVIPLIANYMNSSFGLPAGYIEEYTYNYDGDYDITYSRKGKLSTFYCSTSTFKEWFNEVYAMFAAAAYMEGNKLDKARDYPIGKILDAYGGLREYLTMDLPGATSWLEFSFKSVNYDDISGYDKGNDPDVASSKAVLLQAIYELGEDKFFRVVDVIVRSDYTPASHGDDAGHGAAAAWYDPNGLVAQYQINWPRLFQELTPYEIEVLLPAFYGYLNISAKEKSGGLLSKLISIAVVSC